LKKGIRIGDLLNRECWKISCARSVEWKNSLRAEYTNAARAYLQGNSDWACISAPSCPAISGYYAVRKTCRKEGRIAFEDSWAALRDLYFGIYPYTSSSCALASFAPIGSGLFGKKFDHVVGVVRPFPPAWAKVRS